MLLSPAECEAAAADVRSLIVASGQTAELRRAVEAERLYGSDPEATGVIATIPIELDLEPPIDLGHKIDARASVLPDVVVRPENQLVAGGVPYRVQSVCEIHLFGVVTHKVLHLVRLHGR